jgi:OmpA-OmpF porin, OOP family
VVLGQDRKIIDPASTAVLIDADDKLGWAAAAQIGYDFGMLRLETDIGYQRSNLKNLTVLSTTTGPLAGGYPQAKGSSESWTAMFNGLFDVINYDQFTVFVGGGAGAARFGAKNYRVIEPSAPFLSDNAWVFAWQGVAGARMEISENVDLAVDYRYLMSNRAKLQFANGTVGSTKLKSHIIMAGLAFNFGGPAAPAEIAAAPPAPAPMVTTPEPQAPMPAPPPAPPVPAGPVLVFFDFDSDVISAEGMTVIDQAAALYNSAGTATLIVEGHADRAGSDPYNMELSAKRAAAVKRALIAKGILQDRISTTSFGESRPLIDTMDGVREPQNRRVEIQVK